MGGLPGVYRVADGFERIDEMLGILLETRKRRYAFHVDRDRQKVLFTRGGMQAGAGVVQGGLIRVIYESAPHTMVEEFCTTPAQAAALIEAVMAREQLCRVPRPEAELNP